MNKFKKDILLPMTLAMIVNGVCFAKTVEYTADRYKVILDRSPFGSDPLSSVTTPDITKEAQRAVAEMEKAYRLTYLCESDDGKMVAGFQNLKPKRGEPLSSIVMVGESFMGMKLKSIDLINSEATLEHRNGQAITFQLTKQAEPVKAASKKNISQRRFGNTVQPAKKVAPNPVPQLTPEEQEQRRAEMRKKLQDYQMEVIRKGQPPLPVPLTQEMDDQLVEEGVLPPQ